MILLCVLLIIYIRCTKKCIYYEIDNFLTPEECDLFISMTENNLQPSLVYSSSSDNVDEKQRKSEQVWIKRDTNQLSKKLSQRIEQLSSMPIENQEDIQIVKYTEGGFFNPHYDACDGDKEFCKRMEGVSGPRYMTFLIYLNDDFEGGETVFTKLSRTVKPKKGKVLVFYNTNKNGTLLKDSFHGGNPVTRGNKYIMNVWVHTKTFKI